MTYLSEDELVKLLLYVQEKANMARRRAATRPVVDEALVLLLLNAGLRATELCNLNIGDLVSEHGKDAIRVRDASGNVLRAVQITAEMAQYLRRFLRLHRRHARPDHPFFVSERGTPFTYMSLYNKVKRIGRDAEIGNLHPRILRTTYVVRLYNSKQDLRFVQKQAGHASPRTTAMYAIAGSKRDDVLGVGSDRADHGTIAQTSGLNRQLMTKKRAAKRATNNRKTASANGFQHTDKCEACSKSIGTGGGTRIDSGQILCSDCLRELRGA